MLNRRKFFKTFGSAILGTAIALKIPDCIIPNIPIPKRPENVLTWSILNDAYNRLKESMGDSPVYILVSKERFREINDMSKGLCRKATFPNGQDSIKFNGSEIRPSEFLSDDDIYGSYGAIGYKRDENGNGIALVSHDAWIGI
jgi:hypothetical protein